MRGSEVFIMSKSRLEKFLYALYTLNYDELPIPLSRLETLYNCLVTGEEPPSFTPLSRVEKYLMAILGVYDIGLLPKPLSRIEILLSKLVNDEELGEVDEFLSKHEELLAGIIQQGGLESGNFIEVLLSIDTSFVTLYNTAEKNVKSAVLEGNTLVNICENSNTTKEVGRSTATPAKYSLVFLDKTKDYDVYFDVTDSNNDGTLNVTIQYWSSAVGIPNSNGRKKVKIISTMIGEDFSGISFYFISAHYDGGARANVSNIVVVESNSSNIPYFEGMQSVKMPVLTTTGKNLFDYKSYGGYNTDIVEIENGLRVSAWATRLPFIHNLLPNTTYTSKSVVRIIEEHVGAIDIAPGKIMIYNGSNYLPLFGENGVEYTFKTPSDIKSYDRILFYAHGGGGGKVGVVEITNMQLEKGSTATSYEPYKSNTLTCNEEVELGSIGNVRDELNLLTGELTQKTTESYINNFTANWYVGLNGNLPFYIYKRMGRMPGSDFICDKLPVCLTPTINASYECLAKSNYEFGDIIMYIPQNNITTLDEAVQRLNSYNAKIRYVLNEPNIKTVDLSIVDQDGNDTKLRSFNDITHVITSSEGLIPGGSIEVAKRVQFVDYPLDSEVTTAYNTMEYRVKNAVLKGGTKLIDELGNECDEPNTPKVHMGAYIDTDTGELIESSVSFYTDFLKSPNINFTVKGNNRYKRIVYYDKDKKYIAGANSVDRYNGDFNPQYSLTRPENTVYYRLSASLSLAEDATYTPDTKLSIVDQYNETLYPTELVSVKMPVLTTTGKNLINVNGEKELSCFYNATLNGERWEHNDVDSYTIKIKPNTEYFLTCEGIPSMSHITYWDENLSYIGAEPTYGDNIIRQITSPQGAKYMRLPIHKEGVLNIQIEEGSVATSYEPYKSTSATCNEEVELRGIGDIKDELNLLTGELTGRIGEIILDGSENWLFNAGYKYAELTLDDYSGLADNICVNDHLPQISIYGNENSFNNDRYGLMIGTNKLIRIRMADEQSGQTLDGIKQYLSQNPITVQYQLKTPITKTVDLTTVNQDGKDTKLSSFDDITHVITSSEGLIPGGSIEVATKNMDDVVSINTMSLRMDDISSRQGEIDKTVNEQTDMTSTTMLGVTEIYEEIL